MKTAQAMTQSCDIILHTFLKVGAAVSCSALPYRRPRPLLPNQHRAPMPCTPMHRYHAPPCTDTMHGPACPLSQTQIPAQWNLYGTGLHDTAAWGCGLLRDICKGEGEGLFGSKGWREKGETMGQKNVLSQSILQDSKSSILELSSTV